MARKVFFSFHYGRDVWRVNVVRNSGGVEGVSAAGFHDGSVWEETKKKGDEAIKKLIDSGLDGTSVTVVLIGAETANRTYVSYEMRKASHSATEFWASGSTTSRIRTAKLRVPDPFLPSSRTSGPPYMTGNMGGSANGSNGPTRQPIRPHSPEPEKLIYPALAIVVPAILNPVIASEEITEVKLLAPVAVGDGSIR